MGARGNSCGLAGVRVAELLGHTGDAAGVIAVAVASTAGNPGLGLCDRNLEAGVSGSCGVTCKLSLAFV